MCMRSDTITNSFRCCSQMLGVWLLQPVHNFEARCCAVTQTRPQSSGILAERMGKRILLSAFSMAACQDGYALLQVDARSVGPKRKFVFLFPISSSF